MDGQTTARTRRVILLVRVLAVLSLVPLLVQLYVSLFAAKLGIPGVVGTTQPGVFAGRRWLASILLLLAMFLYLSYWLRVWPARPRWVGGIIAGISVLAALNQVFGGLGGDLWIYAAVVAACALRPRWAALLIVLMALEMAAVLLVETRLALIHSLTLSPATTPRLRPVTRPAVPPLLDMLPATVTRVLPLLVIGLGAALTDSLVRANLELHAARSALARLAVEAERTRLARDLHDVLGHNLSLMAVKMELANRLMGESAHPGASELREVQRLARDTLRDVREVVGGFRQPTLEGELGGAAVALEAAGIALELEDARGVLPPAVEAACAWIVREGVTNVIKHSAAGRCRIEIRRTQEELTVRITDDGRGGGGSDVGMGLQGLFERMAALGGTLTAGPIRSGHGFQIVAELSLAGVGAESGPD
jgi:two-component system sensor histidine kinase DesK